jgi:hypothetical protein
MITDADNKLLKVSQQSGFALPVALFFLVTMVMVAAVVSLMGRNMLQTSNNYEQSAQLFAAAEGALYSQAAQIASNAKQWDALQTLDSPLNYQAYSPLSAQDQNGIPHCEINSPGCHRNMYPYSGGLVKNIGPFAGDYATTVSLAQPIHRQLQARPDTPPDYLISNNQGLSQWVQVERLEQEALGEDQSGQTLDSGNIMTTPVRFRLTAIARGSANGTWSQIPGSATIVGTIAVVP